jgi:hypothetical protein
MLNEDVNHTHVVFIQMRQPDWRVCAIWDSANGKRMAPWYGRGYYNSPPHSDKSMVAGWEMALKAGTMLKAETIEKLAERLGLDSTTLRATVDRYNGFCDKGVNEDFLNALRCSFLSGRRHSTDSAIARRGYSLFVVVCAPMSRCRRSTPRTRSSPVCTPWRPLSVTRLPTTIATCLRASIWAQPV